MGEFWKKCIFVWWFKLFRNEFIRILEIFISSFNFCKFLLLTGIFINFLRFVILELFNNISVLLVIFLLLKF